MLFRSVLLFLILVLWQPPHFWALALRHQAEYRAAGVPVLPVAFGEPYTKVLIFLYAAALLPLSLALWALGFRYRLHSRTLPGHPDIVLRSAGAVVFVHGCFWHRHRACARTRTPKSRVEFWVKKFEDNVRRDRQARRALVRLGWKVIVVWECQTEDETRLRRLVCAKLGRGP